jgi:hypothetical protein
LQEQPMATVDSTYIDKLLATTEQLFNNVYAFECTHHSLPGKSHRGVSITHQDLNERRRDFLDELKNTMSSWVYSKAQFNKILNQAMKERGDQQNAVSFMQQLVKQKFRKGYPQGQFGELLLFNLIQHYFRATPLLRKMPIQTNPAIERHGADAIHYRPENGIHTIYLGEAKSYSSKYKFAQALRESVDSVLKSHQNFQTELGNFVYEDFIDEELKETARQIKNNTLAPMQIQLVCIVSYDETSIKTGNTEAEIKASIVKVVTDRILAFDTAFFTGLCNVTLGRLHLFVMPVWDFKGLLDDFET